MEQTVSMAPGERQFVLDIGTRSVVGIAGRQQGDVFDVEAWDVEPHPRRAMIDGQIEDIEQVARVAGMVKARLEKKLGAPLTRVSVAAAGRALKTARATCKQDLTGEPISAQTAYGLENAAVNEARLQLDGEGDASYYCVGYSVVRYLLDDYPFVNPLGHRATRAEVDVIATFLPAEVVDSLRRCMELLGLEIETLTLEPIAAMRAVIPQDLRLLNLALVDVGAGTSDIAITRESTVAGYTMATVAGDEITECLIHNYLVDFATAERLKMALEAGEPLDYVDILGFAHSPADADVRATVGPAVDNLATTIAQRILACNGDAAPAAVFLVGGGSRTPGLCGKVADALAMPHNKVALAGHNFSGRVLGKNTGMDGPEYATPVGIALIAADNAAMGTATVTVNGKTVRLFTPDSTSVMDALLIAGYRYSDLMGRNGRTLTFTLNGVRTVVRGGPYTTATVTLNGKPAGLTAPVAADDTIGIETAQNGEDAHAIVGSYAPGEVSIRVVLNGAALLAGLVARIGGVVASADTSIAEQDEVELFVLKTLGQLCEAAAVPTDDAAIRVNGVPATVDYLLQDGDSIAVADADGAAVAVPVAAGAVPAPGEAAGGEASPEDEAPGGQETSLSGSDPAEAPPDDVVPTAHSLAVTLNGKNVVLPPKGGVPYYLFDMLALVDIDPQNPKGNLRILVNGAESAYQEELAAGDKIEIGWEGE